MDEVTRLVRAAGAAFAGIDSGTNAASSARPLLEAANYLEFIVGSFSDTGTVDGVLAQFASRELNRTVPGEAPVNC